MSTNRIISGAPSSGAGPANLSEYLPSRVPSPLSLSPPPESPRPLDPSRVSPPSPPSFNPAIQEEFEALIMKYRQNPELEVTPEALCQFKAFLVQGADIDGKLKHKYHLYPIQILALNINCVPLLKAALDAGARIAIPTKYKRQTKYTYTSSPLIDAIKGHNDRAMELLIFHGADVNAPILRMSTHTLLEYAAYHGYAEGVKKLLRAGAVATKAEPLNWALDKEAPLTEGHVMVVKELLNAGADVNGAGYTEENVGLYLSHCSPLNSIVSKPLADGFKLVSQDKLDAQEEIHLEIAKLLIAAGADVMVENSFKCTLLMEACQNNKPLLTFLFLKEGFDPHAQDDCFKTAYDYARGSQDKRCLSVFTRDFLTETRLAEVLEINYSMHCPLIALQHLESVKPSGCRSLLPFADSEMSDTLKEIVSLMLLALQERYPLPWSEEVWTGSLIPMLESLKSTNEHGRMNTKDNSFLKLLFNYIFKMNRSLPLNGRTLNAILLVYHLIKEQPKRVNAFCLCLQTCNSLSMITSSVRWLREEREEPSNVAQFTRLTPKNRWLYLNYCALMRSRNSLSIASQIIAQHYCHPQVLSLALKLLARAEVRRPGDTVKKLKGFIQTHRCPRVRLQAIVALQKMFSEASNREFRFFFIGRLAIELRHRVGNREVIIKLIEIIGNYDFNASDDLKIKALVALSRVDDPALRLAFSLSLSKIRHKEALLRAWEIISYREGDDMAPFEAEYRRHEDDFRAQILRFPGRPAFHDNAAALREHILYQLAHLNDLSLADEVELRAKEEGKPLIKRIDRNRGFRCFKDPLWLPRGHIFRGLSARNGEKLESWALLDVILKGCGSADLRHYENDDYGTWGKGGLTFFSITEIPNALYFDKNGMMIIVSTGFYNNETRKRNTRVEQEASLNSVFYSRIPHSAIQFVYMPPSWKNDLELLFRERPLDGIQEQLTVPILKEASLELLAQVRFSLGQKDDDLSFMERIRFIDPSKSIVNQLNDDGIIALTVKAVAEESARRYVAAKIMRERLEASEGPTYFLLPDELLDLDDAAYASEAQRMANLLPKTACGSAAHYECHLNTSSLPKLPEIEPTEVRRILRIIDLLRFQLQKDPTFNTHNFLLKKLRVLGIELFYIPVILRMLEPKIPTIKCVAYQGEGSPILVPIGNLPPGLHLTLKNLPQVMRLVNQATINKPYPKGRPGGHQKVINLNGIYVLVHRSNHNGTHGARKARMCQVLIEILAQEGREDIREALNSLTEEERLHLIFGAYMLRAGRVDERGHHSGDDYQRRSSQIYDAYARKLNVSEGVREWVKRMIDLSGKPLEGELFPKDLVAYEILTLVHELDRPRCLSKQKMISSIYPQAKERLRCLFGGDAQEARLERLQAFSMHLLHATGCRLHYSFETGDGNSQLFARCGLQGDFCWKQVQEVQI